MLRLICLIAIVTLSQFAYGDNPSIFLIGDVQGTYTGTAFELQTKKGVLTMTNAHICQRNLVLIGMVRGGRAAKLLIVKAVYDKHDLCILSGVPNNTSLKLANDYSPKDYVVVEGFPLGVHAVTHGYIGQYFRSIGDSIMVQYFGHIDHGNSGSPVVDKNGDVVGVISVVSGDGRFGGFVPLEFIKDFLDRAN